jgi:Fe-S oxidoreductase
LDDPDIELVCSQIKSFTSYVGNLYQEGLLKTDFKRLNARLFSHIPCHEKALGNTNSLDFLYQEIPGVEFENLPDACSGMAGTFGLSAHNLELSLKIGKPMLEALAKSSNSIGLTSCSSCKMQMEFGSSKGTFHPAQILAAAYDLMPSLKKRIENARR